MRRSRRQLLILLLSLFAFTMFAALLYQIGMTRLEGKPRGFLDSVEWAAETLSTTGYGADSHWSHPAMVMLVVFVQFVGVFLVFLIIPIYLLPFLAERFEQRVPRTADQHIGTHVIIYRYGPAVESLLQRLRANNVRTLVVETDEAQARAVMELGESVVFTRSEEDALDTGRMDRARAIVANGKDPENAALILRARQGGFRGEIYAFVEDPAHRRPMELAGATAAYTPRHIVAAALAAHASDRMSPRVPGLHQVAGFVRREIRVPTNSPMAGMKICDAGLPVVIVGQWTRSRLQIRCGGSTRIEPGSVLELVGDPESLDRAAVAFGAPLLRNEGTFLIAGFGEVGRKVHELLRDAGEEVRVIERMPAPDVDIVGDVLDPSVLERGRVKEVRALILALDTDDATLFATVIARDAAPDVPVIARVNHGRNLENIHRAGADYALSISDVSGEMLSARLLGRGTRARDEHRRVARVAARPFAGQTLAGMNPDDGAYVVIAVEREGAIVPSHSVSTLAAGDSMWVCGTAEALAKLKIE